MTYADRLKYWAIVRLLPTQRWVILARFHRRSDAEGHLRFLRRQMPNVVLAIVFVLPD
jgi:hypothetical protein